MRWFKQNLKNSVRSATLSVHWGLANETILLTSFHKLQTVEVMSDCILCQTFNKYSVYFWFMDIQSFGFREILNYIGLLLEVSHKFFSCRFVKRSSKYWKRVFHSFDRNVSFLKTVWKLSLESTLHNVGQIINLQKKYFVVV